MESSATDHKLWMNLRSRVVVSNPLLLLQGGSEAGKWRLKEDSLLLIRGFDSVSSSLSHFTGILDSAALGVRRLTKPSLADVLKDGIRTVEQDDDEPKPKKRCLSSTETQEKMMKPTGDLEALKSELSFLRDRCALLEEENRELKHGSLVKEEDDDLVRLQLEALLAEKSRLAGENATILRENEYLHQLVDYHQLTSSQLSPPETSHRMKLAAARSCSRFSLPVLSEEDEEDSSIVS